ncbi:MAG: 2-isopropylmalate synthase, partial [Bacteroidota bacterium]
MTDRIVIFDTTLRDGEQSPGAAMTLEAKLRIARLLAEMGVDVIEAGFPISSPQQAEAVREIVSALGDEGPVVAALARAHEADVAAAAAALADGSNTRIHTFIATSDVHIAAKFSAPRFGSTMAERRESVLRMATEAIQHARTHTDDLEFSAEDAGRTDHAFLCDVVCAAVEAGATTINIPDTTGYCTPQSYAALFEAASGCCDLTGVTLSTHCHDDLGLAVANTLAGVEAGARQVEVTINGLGERAGNASLEEVAMALRVRSDHYGVSHAIDTTRLNDASRLVSIVTGFPVPPNKAIVGANAFAHEAGIHQHGVLKNRDTYEIMRAEDVGADVEQIRLGRHSGRHGLFARLDRLGLTVEDDQRDAVYDRFVALADKKKEVYDADLELIADP